MTQDEIMAMWNSVIKYAPSEVRITEFANLVAAKEREACALICDDQALGAYWEGADACAYRIRARGEQA